MSYCEIIYNPDRSVWEDLCARPSKADTSAEDSVKCILDNVKKNGDEALRELSLKFDGLQLDSIEVGEKEFAEAESLVSDKVKKAIGVAIGNITAFHRAQMPSEICVETLPGVKCMQKPVPISRVGLYVPGGTAPLFSTVLMLAVPAKIAGCPEVILCTPASRTDGKVAPEVLYAAKQCGVDKVYKTGGAQAIAAMAYGTGTIGKVDKIFGPGNRFVTTAKQMLGGNSVAIDMPAGPSEVMVLADESANPEFIASDMLSQAEHGADSQAMLVCSSCEIADKTIKAIEKQTKLLGRTEYIEKSLSKSRIIVFDGAGYAAKMLEFANKYAPEHLILSMQDSWSIAEGVTSAGSVFIGNYSPESAGDYASGTNHTLPTSGWGRSYSGVNIDSFIRKITFQELTREGLERLSDTIISMADAEGLQAHANAVKTRLEK